MDIAFLGLGGMGSAMARNLLKAGHKLMVYNRSPDPANALRPDGARVANTPAWAAAAGIAITMLADDHALEAVALGPNGLIEGLPAGGLHISMSTISVDLADRLTAAHQEKGQHFICAPVFGRPEAAASAKLFVAAAGDAAQIARAQPLFDAMGQRTFILGDTPSQASLVKLTGNFLITTVIESLAEAFALTEKGGIATESVYQLLTETLFSAPIYKTYGAIIKDAKYSPPGFKLPLGLKDNRLVQQAAEALAVPLPMAGLVRDRLLASIAKGDGDLDWSAFARRAREDAGL